MRLISSDPEADAETAGLHHVADDRPGIRRIRRGRGFSYRGPDDRPVAPRPGLPPERVLALVVRLLDDTLIRVGNAEYANDNDTFGLTTLRDDHVEVDGTRAHLTFVGKSGVEHDVVLPDRRLAGAIRRCHELRPPGGPGRVPLRHVRRTLKPGAQLHLLPARRAPRSTC